MPEEAVLRFERFPAESSRLDPAAGFGESRYPVEVRRDPITGETVHLAHTGAVRPQPLEPEHYAAPEVRGFCPFCEPHRETVTPMFPPRFIPEGRLRRGEALLVPNLYPYDVHSTVVVMTRQHVVPPGAFSLPLLVDALELGVEGWRRLLAADPGEWRPVMGWNFMPPSGGGLVHPHQQYLLTRFPGRRYEAEFAAARRFHRAHGRDPWTVLVEQERTRGERHLGTTGRWEWLAAFAPRGILGEITAVLPGAAGLDALDGEALLSLADGLLRIFAWMGDHGLCSFNATLFVPPHSEPVFPIHLNLVPRTFLNLRDMAPDMNFLQVLMEEPVSVVRPEDLAAGLREYLSVEDGPGAGTSGPLQRILDP